MKPHRDWEAHYYARHGHWGVTATAADCEPRPDNGEDRYCVFDSLEDDDEATHRLIAAAPALLDAHEPDATPAGPDFLDWVADRLVEVHGESPHVDFVLALRRKAAKARAAIARAMPQATAEIAP